MRQTQSYCQGDYSAWDSKTATFPGLFILGSVYGRILSFVLEVWPTPPRALGPPLRPAHRCSSLGAHGSLERCAGRPTLSLLDLAGGVSCWTRQHTRCQRCRSMVDGLWVHGLARQIPLCMSGIKAQSAVRKPTSTRCRLCARCTRVQVGSPGAA